jgi:hypothetical protein
VKLLLFINLFLLLYTTLFSQKKTTSKDFKFRPSKQGGQVGSFDAEGLPTSIKINDEWVLPRNGTMEWLMTKGYVPDSDDRNVMKPNPNDKRYRPPRRILAPSLGLTPVDYIAKPKTLFDPFKGIAGPREENFSPRIGDGVKNGDNLEGANPGPVLEPELPALKNTPFDEPPQKGHKLPIAPNLEVDPFNQEPKKKLPPSDPFAEDNLNQPNQLPEQNKDQLPGKKINLPNSIFNP